jgi:hypothetical protein
MRRSIWRWCNVGDVRGGVVHGGVCGKGVHAGGIV